jgi:hypothetical protein
LIATNCASSRLIAFALAAFAFGDVTRETSSLRRRYLFMSKLVWTVLFTACAAYFADQYFNHGRHTEGMIATLRQIQQALGW